MTIQGILFDKDGTLFDFRATWSPWAKSFLSRVCKGDQHRATLVGQAVGFDFQSGEFSPSSIIIAGTPAEIADVLIPQFSEYSAHEILDIINQEAEAAPMAEAVPLAPFLGALKTKGLKLGVATNDAEAPARAHLNAVGVLDQFDFVVGSDSGYGGKPAPGQMLAFCDKCDLDPAQLVMVGDSLHDMRAGRAAGFQCIAVLTGLAGADVLAPEADVVLPDIGHILSWLDGAGS